MVQSERPARTWFIAGAALAAIIVGYALNLASPTAAEAQVRTRVAGRATARSHPLDLSSPIHVESGSCVFAPNLMRAFDNLLHQEGAEVVPRAVRFGTLRLVPSLTTTWDGNIDGASGQNFPHYDSVVRFEIPALWNGLRLRALRAEVEGEWAASTMEFDNSPAQVRAAMRRMGIRIPASGMLDLPVPECASSIRVEAEGGGTALSCSEAC